MKEVVSNNQVIISGINTNELMELFKPMIREAVKREREEQRKKFFLSISLPNKISSLTACREHYAEKQNQ